MMPDAERYMPNGGNWYRKDKDNDIMGIQRMICQVSRGPYGRSINGDMPRVIVNRSSVSQATKAFN